MELKITVTGNVDPVYHSPPGSSNAVALNWKVLQQASRLLSSWFR